MGYPNIFCCGDTFFYSAGSFPHPKSKTRLNFLGKSLYRLNSGPRAFYTNLLYFYCFKSLLSLSYTIPHNRFFCPKEI